MPRPWKSLRSDPGYTPRVTVGSKWLLQGSVWTVVSRAKLCPTTVAQGEVLIPLWRLHAVGTQKRIFERDDILHLLRLRVED